MAGDSFGLLYQCCLPFLAAAKAVDMYLYLAADLENTRKRFNKQLNNAIEYGKEDIFLDIREMRNRVSHQETIFNRDVEKTYENICFILKIYSNDLYKWFDCECKIKMPREFND